MRGSVGSHVRLSCHSDSVTRREHGTYRYSCTATSIYQFLSVPVPLSKNSYVVYNRSLVKFSDKICRNTKKGSYSTQLCTAMAEAVHRSQTVKHTTETSSHSSAIASCACHAHYTHTPHPHAMPHAQVVHTCCTSATMSHATCLRPQTCTKITAPL